MHSHAETMQFTAPASVNTPTSPNTNVVTTPTFDTNNTTNMSFQYQGRIPVWTPSVSQAAQTAELGNDIAIGNVVWLKGLKVTYQALSATLYTVILDGRILDGGTIYTHVGTTLGIFTRSDSKPAAAATPLKLAGLKEATFMAPPSVNTPTSPNTNVVTTPTFDTNNTTNMSFQYQGRIPVWTPSVSQSVQTAELGNDTAIGSVVWVKGLKVTYQALSATQYSIILDGKIMDGGTIYTHVGTTLGIFARSDSTKAKS